MMSLQASLLGFAVFKVLPRSGLFDNRPLSIHENVSTGAQRSSVQLAPLHRLTPPHTAARRLSCKQRQSRPAHSLWQPASSASSLRSECSPPNSTAEPNH